MSARKGLFVVAPLVFCVASADCQNNPLTSVLNENDLSSAPLVYQQRIVPGALLVYDRFGHEQYPDPVPLLVSMKVLNEAPFLAHSDIKVAQQKGFFLSLLGYDPSAKFTKGSGIEIDQTDFLSTSITDGQMEQLVYHDAAFKSKADQVIRDGGSAYLIESVWLATRVHATQVSSSGVALSSGSPLPTCTATLPGAGTPVPAVPVSPAPQTEGPSVGQPTGAASALLSQPVTNTVNAASNAVVNATNAASKIAAQTVVPVKVGFEACSNGSALVEFTSTRPIPIGVKLQRVFQITPTPESPNGLDYGGIVENF